jgi:hypothetical protein
MSTKASTPTTDTVIENLIPGSVKAAMKVAGASSSNLWMVPYSQLRVIEGFNVRIRNAEYLSHVQDIKNSIIRNGYYRDRPLEGYVGKDDDGENVIFVTGGHTRHEAVGEAIEEGHGIESIPVIVKPQGTSQEDLTVALVTGNNGRPLSPIETAIVCKRLQGFGLDNKAIADRLCFTKKYVDNLFELLAAPAAVRKLVEQGKVSASLAIEELKKDGKGAAKKLTEAVEVAEASGKKKVTKKTLTKGDTKAKNPEIVVDVYAPAEDLEANDYVTFFVRVPREHVDAVDGKRLRVRVLGDVPKVEEDDESL